MKGVITVLVTICAAAWLAATSLQPAGATAAPRTASRSWSSCRPRAILGDPQYPGYRLDNDVFAGYSGGRYCLTGTSDHGFRTLDAAVPDAAGTVVAYPKVYIGQNYNALDPQSGLPVRASDTGRLMLHIGSWGHPSGRWQSDSDDWLWPTRNTSGHGRYELVIATRVPGHVRRACDVRLQGICWYYGPWVTHQTYRMNGKVVHGSWPLIYFVASDPDIHTMRIDLPLFIAHAVATGWLPRTAWLGQVSFGTEVWSGGAGLHDTMAVTWTGRSPR